MFDDFNEKLAKLVVNYSVRVQKGHTVMITGGIDSADLVRELNIECVKAGGHVVNTNLAIPGTAELFFKYAQEHQLNYANPFAIDMIKKIDKYINVFGLADGDLKQPCRTASSQPSPGVAPSGVISYSSSSYTAG